MSRLPSAGSKDTVLMAISSGPSFNYTSHKKDAVAGYTLYSFIDNAEATAEHTFFNGQPAYLLDQTTQPKCFGDAAGIGGGVKSGTIGGEVKPTSGSSTIFIEGKALIREGDTCTMNNGNVKGKYVTVDAAQAEQIMAQWADQATKDALADGGLWAMSELIYQEEANALWINVKGDEKAYYEGLKKIAERDMVALDILTMGYPIGKVGSLATQGAIRSVPKFSLFRVPATRILEKPRKIWGRSAKDIAKDFEDAGYTVVEKGSTKLGNKSEVIQIQGHKQITQIQVSPSSKRHGGKYYKISTSDRGIVKVVDKKTYKPTPSEKATIIYK